MVAGVARQRQKLGGKWCGITQPIVFGSTGLHWEFLLQPRVTRPTDSYSLLRALLTALGPARNFTAEPSQIIPEVEVGDLSLWQQLVGETDYHGVTLLLEPIVAAVLRATPGAISDDARRAFYALASRHRQLAIVREDAIDRLLAAFSVAGVRAVLLKGAVLAHQIYPAPQLRPMLDIDVLIDPVQAEAAVKAASDIGYRFASRHSSKFAGRLHHLPVGEITQSGFQIYLELHIDAMHLDQPRRLTFSDLASPPRPFRRGSGPDGLALGHTDMLRHLSGHAFDPAHRVRLIHLYDLWRYQAIFHDEIDWTEIETRFGHVMTVLRLVAQVFPKLPSAAASPEIEAVACTEGLGLAMLPLSDIAASDMGLRGKLAAIFNPPAWWLHGFYGVPPEQSLLVCRTLRHPAMVARWLLARGAVFAGLGGNWNWVQAVNDRRAGPEEES
jgi:hypothetical protein